MANRMVYYSIQYAIRDLVQGFSHSPWIPLEEVTTREKALAKLQFYRKQREQDINFGRKIFRAVLKEIGKREV